MRSIRCAATSATPRPRLGPRRCALPGVPGCLILLGLNAPFKPGIPSVVPSCEGFVDWGPPHLLALVTEVSTRALKAVWYHKWFVHRRMRPEAFGGLVHNQLTGAASYPMDTEVLDSAAVQEAFSRNGSYLLPQAFVEGSPTHPSYGSGHATVAGACVTILKAWFDESFVIPNPVRPSSDGMELLPYSGPPLSAGGELNKVAANVAVGRDAAGVHWLTDYYHSLRLGEYIAKTILEEQKGSYSQSPTFVFTSFDGKQVTI
jgi:membrane-associated phospholipid phosphatase